MSQKPEAAADYSLRILWSLARWIEDKKGAAELARIAAAADVRPEDFDGSTRWVSHEQLEKILALSRELAGSDDALVAAFEHRFKESFGPFRYMIWGVSQQKRNELAVKMSEKVATRLFMGPINRERERRGLAAFESFHRYLVEGVPYMLACDPLLVPSPPDWDQFDITTTGPWFYDDPAPLPSDVVAFIEAGAPPVYVGFGSMASDDAAEATRAIVAGAGAGGRRVLLSKGWAGLGDGSLPSSVMVVKDPMPHAKLFPRVAAVVHHGGAGTTAAAMRAGVAQVIVPHIVDQYYYAHRLELLGLAPKAIPVTKLNARRLASALDAARELPPRARMQAAARLREGDGLLRAVELIETRIGPRAGQIQADAAAALT